MFVDLYVTLKKSGGGGGKKKINNSNLINFDKTLFIIVHSVLSVSPFS